MWDEWIGALLVIQDALDVGRRVTRKNRGERCIVGVHPYPHADTPLIPDSCGAVVESIWITANRDDIPYRN